MTKKIQIKCDFAKDIHQEIQELYPDIKNYRILGKSLDSRGANRGKRPEFHYTVEVDFQTDEACVPEQVKLDAPPIIVGLSPAGLFCAMKLLDHGIKSIIVERGDRSVERMRKIAGYWRYGDFDSENNVCFGEGGAGLFSDGKLNTRVKSLDIPYVMQAFVRFGAPEETAYSKNPHLGSHLIRKIIGRMTDYLVQQGCEIKFRSKVVDLLSDADKISGVELASGEKIRATHVILATGHSARDVYSLLKSKSVSMKPKDFAVGVRIEHSKDAINKMQYGPFAGESVLGDARYNLTFNNKKTAYGTYSFCMCPGGVVLNASSEKEYLVTNGMSNRRTQSPWSNSAIVTAVKCGKDFSEDDALAGMNFQKIIESNAYKLSQEYKSGKELPAIRLDDFLEGRQKLHDLPTNSVASQLFKTNLDPILPKNVLKELAKAIRHFDFKIKGFVTKDAILVAPETRTSAPITVIRDKESLQSLSYEGLYPCGEGAGYAGGITSAAVDGIKVAKAICSNK